MMTSDDLFDYVKTVNSRKDFIKFVGYLNEDHKKNSEEWSNKTLEDFLGGLSGFAIDMNGYYQNIGEATDVESITWRIAAEMLLAATVYGG
jgi:hypothetical protein